MFRISQLLGRVWKPLVSSERCGSYSKQFYDRLKLCPEPNYSRMDNGLSVASQELPGAEHMCVGLFIDGGSRYESEFENGIAHFFEHIAFKSTCNRSAHTLRKHMNDCGARFKCLTGREMVAYYAECLSEDITLVIDILADCVFNNAMNYHEIEKQKEIVYQEMIEKDVDTNEVLFDYLHGAAFFGTPLAQSVMGRTSNLQNFCESTIRGYVGRIFDPTRMVLAAAGGVCHEQLVSLAQCYMLRLEPSKCTDEVYRFTAGDFRFRDDSFPYCNAAIAFEAPCFCDDRRWVMDVAKMHIGGWDRRQPRGRELAHLVAKASHFAHLAYGYRSFYLKYKDTGLWGVHFLGEKVGMDMLLYNIQSDFMNLCCTITENETERAKNALKAKLMAKLEGVTACCFDLGRWTLYYGRRPMLHEQLCEVEAVSAASVRSACDYFLYDRCPAVAGVGPVEGLPHHTRIRAGQYWVRI